MINIQFLFCFFFCILVDRERVREKEIVVRSFDENDKIEFLKEVEFIDYIGELFSVVDIDFL